MYRKARDESTTETFDYLPINKESKENTNELTKKINIFRKCYKSNHTNKDKMFRTPINQNKLISKNVFSVPLTPQGDRY